MLVVHNLHVDHVRPGGVNHTVKGVSFRIGEGEIFGLAGESGSGKSTTAKAILRVLRPPAIISGGEVVLDDVDVFEASAAELRSMRWRTASMVFQDAMDVLNPVLSLEAQLVDVLFAHGSPTPAEARTRAGELLEMVGIGPERLAAYPHELSGGMRQRVALAMAMALRPKLVVMDEPTTALDVVVQREILARVLDLQASIGFAILFITHDVALLLEFAQRIGIMYGGQLVEVAPASELATAAQHPYTRGLLRSFPSLETTTTRLEGIGGPALDPRALPPGCLFEPRCVDAHPTCTEGRPAVRVLNPDHCVACIRR
ncbi:MAG: ABC transporter ATP-binding protein [Nannocystales bacterium]